MESRSYQLLRNWNFLLFVAGRSANTLAVHGLTVAIGWHVYKLTSDPLDLGLVGLAQFAPAFVFFLAAGMAADRFERRSILAICAAAHFIVTLALFWAVTNALSVNLIFLLLALHGTARSFYHTASQAVLPNLVTKEQFPNAIAWSSSANKAGQLLGPAAAGGLIAWIGDSVYWPILAMFALAGFAAAALPKTKNKRIAKAGNLSEIMGGFVYVWREKIVLGAITIDLLAVMLGGVMGLLPIYAADILNVGPEGLGIMRAMPGVGSLVVGIGLANLAAPRRMGPMMFISLFAFGISIVVFSISTAFWLSLAALALYGGADMISVYVRQTLTQIATPDYMRGRVSAVNSISINASNELGDFRAGITAAAIGTIPAVLVGGIAVCGITLLWAYLFPEIRRVDRLRDVQPKL